MPEPFAAKAAALLRQWVNAGIARLVPDWFPSEIANVLYRKGRSVGTPTGDAITATHAIMAMVGPQTMDAATVARAIEIADQLNQPRVYDALYLALAEREDCDLWTADERFFNAARARFPQVRWIGLYAPSGTP